MLRQQIILAFIGLLSHGRKLWGTATTTEATRNNIAIFAVPFVTSAYQIVGINPGNDDITMIMCDSAFTSAQFHFGAYNPKTQTYAISHSLRYIAVGC